ncbi:redoxin domain-containing protein [Proteobacteria bacterium 005FR1]|nr:redoxin domain-containing protein [Proteobacteria bacterium 005FR1]
MKLRSLLLPLLFTGMAGPALALTPGDRVDNFKLLDHAGSMHELHYLSDMKAVVLMVHGNDCPVVKEALGSYKALQDRYGKDGVAFLMINSNLQDDRESIAKEAAKLGIETPILLDSTQLIGESLGLERMAETFVIDPRGWKVVYRGALNGGLGQKSSSADYVADALDALIAGKAVKVAASDAKGCAVTLPELARRDAHKEISYADDIAPILIDKCVDCHRDGGIGPFAMNSYAMIRGFAPMIREVVRTKRMPPWHADPHIGTFENDRSLSEEETKKLVHWIEAGAPRGKGEDTLANYKPDVREWAMGEPDAIVDVPATDVPATGVVDYKYLDVKNPLGKDVWIKAVQVLPGSRAVLHHTIISFSHKNGGSSLPGYVPGDAGYEFPAGTGVFLPKDATFRFQMHYTTYGKPETDATRLGIYFHDEAPAHEQHSQYLAKPNLLIPAGVKEHWEESVFPIKRDILLYSILPHAHFRGKAMEFQVQYPDGRTETLLNVPNYDFNWQTTYVLDEPKVLPAGTKVVYRTSWDNSTQNPANPDPSIDVRWGEQSWEEMLFGAFRFRYLDEAKLSAAE